MNVNRTETKTEWFCPPLFVSIRFHSWPDRQSAMAVLRSTRRGYAPRAGII